MEIRGTAPDHPAAVALIVEIQKYYVEVYGGHDIDRTEPILFEPPNGCFLVGYVDGVAVAGGGWHASGPESDDRLLDGDAELVRIFVSPGHRGNGYSRVVLAELERSVAAAGRRRMVLETGALQEEAIGLYVAAGYHPIPTFGYYRDSPLARSFAKSLWCPRSLLSLS